MTTTIKPLSMQPKLRLLMVTLSVILLSLVTNLGQAQSTATVSTDSLDYHPGSTVHITGSGFQAGETVTLQVTHVGDGDNDISGAHAPWSVAADASGSISATWIVPLDQDELGATLLLTADGKTSLLHAEEYFTDATITISSNTNWSAISTGSGPGGQPSASDAIVVKNNAILTVDVSNGSCLSIQLGEKANTGGQGNNNSGNGTLIFNSGSKVACEGDVIVGESGSGVKAGTLTMTSGGILQIKGSLTLNTGNYTFNAGSGASGGTIEFNASGSQNIFPTTYNNLTVSGSGIKSLTNTTNAGGTLTVKAGTTLDLNVLNLGASTSPNSIVLENGLIGSSITGSTGTLTLGGDVTVNYTGVGTNGASISCPISLVVGRTFNVADDGTSATDLTISGVINNPTTNRSITKAGAGTLLLSAANTYSGGTNIITGIIAIGNNSAFGTGAVSLGGTSSNTPTIIASGTSRTIANDIVLLQTSVGGNPTIGGSNNITFTGSVTNSGASRILSVNSVGNTSFNGSIFLSELSSTGRTLTINGSGNVNISGVVSNFNGSGTAGNLVYSGTGLLTLSNSANTYSGTTTISSGEVRVTPNNTSATFASQIVLNGGKLSSTSIAASTVWTSSSTLNLNANSSIDLGSNVHSLKFANSSAVSWSGSTLTINNWSGTPGSSGSAGKLFIGSDATGLSAAQLSKIQFNISGITYPATILSTGEIVPKGNSITTGTITGSPFCAETSGISVPFTYSTAAAFNGTTFTAQLSDASGSFASPTNLQAVSSDQTGSQSISITIPSGTASGTGYRIRVVSNTPPVNGSDNGVNLTINAIPTLSGTGSSATAVCEGSSATVTLSGLLASTQHSISYTIGGTAGTQTATATSNASGVASFNTIILTTANSGQTITITGLSRADVTPGCAYTPDANNTAILPTVNPNLTPSVSVAQTVGSNPTCSGSTITFTATASNTGGGTVTYAFKDGASTLQSSISNTYTTTSLGTGAHSITVDISVSGGTCLTATTASSDAVSITENAPPSISGQPSNFTTTYGDGDVSFTATASGTPTPTYQWQVNTGSGFSDISDATSSTLTVSSPTVAMSGYLYHVVITNSCLSVTSDDVSLTVNAKTITVTPDADQHKIYGDANPTYTYQFSPALVGSDAFIGSLSRYTGEDAGLFNITQGDLALSTNYDLQFTTGVKFEIKKKAATVSADAQSKTYGDDNPTLTATVDGTVNGDNLNYSLATSALKFSNVGDYAITVTLGSNPNYSVTPTDGNLHIGQKAATVSADAQSKTYGDDNPTLTATVDGTVNGDNLNYSLATSALKFSNVGDYAITVTLGSNPNYSVTPTDGNLHIGQKAATVSADAQSKTYGDDNPTLTATVDGTVNGDNLNYSLATSALKFSNVGDYAITVTLGSNPNYSVTPTDGNLHIGQKAATVSADAQSKTYGDDNPTLTATVDGTVNGDNLNYSLATSALKFSNVGDYAITVTLGSNPNYSVTPTDGNLHIGQKAATVSADAQSKTYGDDNPTLTATVDGTVNGDNLNYSLATSALKFSNVGDYAITVTLGSNPNYSVTPTDGNLHIGQKAATVSADAQSKTYGDDNPTLTATVDGTVNGDNLNYSLATSALKFSNVGDYAITVTLGSNPNYSVTPTDGNLHIGQKAATVSADAQSKTYGDDNPTLTATVDGTVNGDNLNYSLATSALKFSNVGDYAITVTLGSNPNYSVTPTDGNLHIGQKAATVSADAQSKTYGDDNPTLTATVDGTVNGDNLNYSLATSALKFSNVGDYAITVTLGSNPNYSVTPTDGNLHIGQKAATVSADAQSKTYGDDNPTLTATVDGTVNGDNLNYSLATSALKFSNVGDYAITVTLGSNPNYSVTPTDGNLHIGQKAATVSADAQSKTYGDDNPTLTATVDGTVNGDNLNYSLATSALKFSNVGDYAITVTLGSNPNYSVTPTDGNLHIGQKAATVSADAQSKTYGDDNPTLTATVDGTVNGDNLNYSLATSALKFSNVGDYAITVTLGSNPNYSVTPTDGNLHIGQKAATVSADAQSKTYGDDNPTLTATVDGTVNGDNLNYSLATSALKFSNVGDYAITVTLGSNPNYSVTPTDGNLHIGQKAATVSADAQSKTYGDDNPTLTATVDGTVNGDNLNYSLATSALKFSNVGDYAITVTLGSNPNYSVTPTDGNLHIGQKAATVSADAQSKTYGDDNPTLTATVDGTVNGDNLNYSLATSALKFSNVGDYAITVTLGSNPNYSVTPTDGNLHIGQKAATVSADAQSKTYGDDNPTLTATVDGTVNGDNLNYSLATSALKFSNVGDYAITVTLGSNPNYSVTPTDGNLHIGQKAATVSADAQSKTYGDDNPTLTATVDGTVNGDNLNYSLATSALKFSNVGDYAITVTLGSNPNYSVTPTDGNLHINPRLITITADAKSKTYGDIDPVFTAQITSGTVVNEDAASGSMARVAGENIGNYQINKGNYSYGANYSETFIPTNLSITPLGVMVTADAKTKVYGQLDPSLTFVSSPTVGTVLPNGQSIAFAGSLTRVSGENVANYQIEQGTVANGNYTITYVPANLSITPLAVTLKADAKTKVYGSADPALTYTSVPVVNYQLPNGLYIGFTGSLTRASGETVLGGPYPIQQGTVDNSNYSITYVPANLTITTKGLTVTSDSHSKVYGQTLTNADHTGSLTGVVPGDNITVTRSSTGDPAAATVVGSPYKIVNTLVDPDSKLSNYSVTNTCGVLTVVAAAVNTFVTVSPITPVAYSDEVTLTAKIVGGAPLYAGGPQAAQTVTFSIGGQIMNTTGAILSVSGNDLVATWTGQLLETTVTGSMAPQGGKSVSATFNSVDNNFSLISNPKSTTMDVIKESAVIDYIGNELVATISTTNLTANIDLRVSVQDIDDSKRGDIKNAKVKFVFDGTIVMDWTPISTLVDPYTGVISKAVTKTLASNSTSEIYQLDVYIDNYYKANVLSVPITVYLATGDFITGGGHIIPTSSAGVLPSAPNSRTNFGFNVKYNKKATSLQGKLNFIWTSGGRVYQAKSNATDALGVNIADPTAQTANFTAKCSVVDITDPNNPITTGPNLGGNRIMQVIMTDRGEPGNKDDIGFTLWDGNTLVYSSQWAGTSTTKKVLAGGNLVVHSGFSLGGNEQILVNKNDLQVAPLTVPAKFDATAYPNPTTSQFNVKLESSNRQEEINIIVYNMNGKVVETKQHLTAGQTIQLGALYRPGVYILEMIQGNQRKQIKLVKIPD